ASVRGRRAHAAGGGPRDLRIGRALPQRASLRGGDRSRGRALAQLRRRAGALLGRAATGRRLRPDLRAVVRRGERRRGRGGRRRARARDARGGAARGTLQLEADRATWRDPDASGLPPALDEGDLPIPPRERNLSAPFLSAVAWLGGPRLAYTF